MSLSSAADAGDRRKTLEELRRWLASAIEVCEPHQAAPLAKQLRETMAELDALPDGKEKSTSDDLAAKRAARRSESKAVEQAGGGGL